MIYFARTHTGSIKIGHTTGPIENRLKLLRTYYLGHPVELLATREGTETDERSMHQKFSHLRIDKTEQFRPGPDLMGFIGLPAVKDHEMVKLAEYMYLKTADGLEPPKDARGRPRKAESERKDWRSVRLSDETRNQLADLERWLSGPLGSPTTNRIIQESIRVLWEQEKKKRETP